jgi:hypothetical protein
MLADPRTNLLAALPDGEWERWLPLLELVELPLGKVLYEAGQVLVGISLLMGGASTPARAVVQSAGSAFGSKRKH